MDKIISIITLIGSVCSALIVLGTFISIVFKLPMKWFKKSYEEHTEKIVTEKVNEVKSILNDMTEAGKKNEEATKASIRHEITYIYEKYKDRKVLPGNTKNDLCSLYEAYTLLNGNSYIHEIYEEMMKWDTE